MKIEITQIRQSASITEDRPILTMNPDAVQTIEIKGGIGPQGPKGDRGEQGMGTLLVTGTQTEPTEKWTGDTDLTELEDGQQIVYCLPYSSSGYASLNLTLSDGSTTGAKTVYYNGKTVVNYQYPAGSAIHMTYRKNATIGTQTGLEGWWCDADMNTWETIDDRVVYRGYVTAGETLSSNCLVGFGTDGKIYKPGGYRQFDITKPWLITQYSFSADQQRYGQCRIASGQSTSVTAFISNSYATQQNLATGETLYFKGTLSGKIFRLQNSSYLYATTTPPEKDDGYYYMAMGRMTSGLSFVPYIEHPIFAYKRGEFTRIDRFSAEAYDKASTAYSWANSQWYSGMRYQASVTDWSYPSTDEDGSEIWVENETGNLDHIHGLGIYTIGSTVANAPSTGTWTNSQLIIFGERTYDETVPTTIEHQIIMNAANSPAAYIRKWDGSAWGSWVAL